MTATHMKYIPFLMVVLLLQSLFAIPLETTTGSKDGGTSTTQTTITPTTKDIVSTTHGNAVTTTDSSDESDDDSDETVLLPHAIVQQFRILEIIIPKGNRTSTNSTSENPTPTVKPIETTTKT